MSDNNILDFGTTVTEKCIIKVIGVGGGGGNAVNHMYLNGIHDVSFLLCNTDAQALKHADVPSILQLGHEGLGAGNRPAKAREAAEESKESVRTALDDGTRMVFITAGMGGGTGTGAAPVIAREAKNMGILTVGIVTIPFQFEGKQKINQALDGVEEMEKNVDALLVINNQRLIDVYKGLSVNNAFAKADDTLSIAAKGIADIITENGKINLDFNDVKTILKDGGVAVMSTGYGEGEGRVTQAINEALTSPLLNENNVFNAKKILIAISSHADLENGNDGLMIDEMEEINEFMEKFADFEFKWGMFDDPSLDKKVKVTILATGFELNAVDEKFGKRSSAVAIRQKTEEEEKNARQAERIERYYGGDANKKQKKRPKIYLINEEDFDNDDLILAMENTPTYGRQQSNIDSLDRLSVLHDKMEEDNEEGKNAGQSSSSIISF